MANRPIVIDSTAGLPTGESGKWSQLLNMPVFVRDIVTPALKATTNVGDIVSGIPTAFARLDLFKAALDRTGKSSSASVSGLNRYYEALVKEWRGFIAALALDYPKFQVRRIDLAYHDGKDVRETENIYEPLGAFGNMLLERAPLWCAPSDLYCTAYSTREYSNEQPRRACLKGKGGDPRLVKAIGIIKGDIQKDNPWVEFSDIDLQNIEEEARAFIDSGKVSASVRITVSDGTSGQAYLTKAAVALSADADLRTRLRIMLDDMGLAPESTTAILKGENTCNEFFRSQLNPFFSELLELQGDTGESVRDTILDYIISARPNIVRPVGATVPSAPMSVPDAPMSDEKYRYWSREKRIRLAEAKAKARQPNFNYKAAIEMVETLKDGLKIAGISEFNDELNHWIDDWKARLVEADDRTVTRVNKKSLLDLVKKAGDAARKLSDSLEQTSGEAARKLSDSVGQTSGEAARRFSGFMEQTAGRFRAPATPRPAPASQAPSVVRPAVSPDAPATELMKAGRFMEAKRKFALERNSAMAELCTKLINVSRDVTRLRSQANMATHAMAPTALNTLGNARALYVQAGLDVADIDQLILKYSNL